MAAPTTAQYIFSKVNRLGMPLPMDMLPMDISMPPIDISIVKELTQSRVELRRRTKCSATREADAALQVMGSRTGSGTESDMGVFWSTGRVSTAHGKNGIKACRIEWQRKRPQVVELITSMSTVSAAWQKAARGRGCLEVRKRYPRMV